MSIRINGQTGIDVGDLPITNAGNAEVEGTLAVQGQNVTPFSGFKNYIINGNFDIWQRGTSFTGLSADPYHSDRFCSASTFPTGAVNIIKNSITYNGNKYNSAKCTVTTAYNTLGTNYAYRHFCYFMEGIDSSVVNKAFTLSFLFNTNTAGTYTVSFRCAGSVVSVYKTRITAISGIQKVIVNVPANTLTIPNLDNNLGLQIYIGGVAGTTYQGLTSTLNQWDSTTTTIYYPNEFNWASTVGNYIEIAQVQLEEGSVATPFENRPYGLELSLCQRYLPSFTSFAGVGTVKTPTMAAITIPFPVETRVPPTGITVTGYATIENAGTWTEMTGVFSSASRTAANTLWYNPAATMTLGQGSQLNLGVQRLYFTGCEL